MRGCSGSWCFTLYSDAGALATLRDQSARREVEVPEGSGAGMTMGPRLGVHDDHDEFIAFEAGLVNNTFGDF